MSKTKSPCYNRRGELQSLLGDRGTVLERQIQGTPDRPAAGWYAELDGGGIVFLGDRATIASMRIGELLLEHAGA